MKPGGGEIEFAVLQAAFRARILSFVRLLPLVMRLIARFDTLEVFPLRETSFKLAIFAGIYVLWRRISKELTVIPAIVRTFLTELREIVRTGIVSKCIRSELGAAPADTAKILEGRRVYMSKVSKLITG